MTAEQVFDKWCDTSYPMDFEVFKYLAITAMKEYGRIMCDKQKEICACHTEGTIDSYILPDCVIEYDEEVLKAPYPDELKDS